ncbi:PAS domain-containing protein [Mariniflexile jejuense]|uniref:PAS domain-containing protein n=1 Tax=Mariniflexile jejuense TaxID=1173582 RepID=A0ABW3JJB1_9FLAO
METTKHHMWRLYPDIAISKFITKNIAFSVSDKNGRIVYANEKFCGITGRKENELIGVENSLYSATHHKDLFYKHLWHTIEQGLIWNGILKNTTKTGKKIYLETTIVPIKDDDGNIESYVSMFLDASEIKTEAVK